MSTETQYNPNHDFNNQLKSLGLSKTVYAMVNHFVENTKYDLLVNKFGDFVDQNREPWTNKQDAYHVEFFNKWVKWSSPVVEFNRENYPYFYPTAGASEPLRQIIFSRGALCEPVNIHVFTGEYEGYEAMAQAANITVVKHDRDDWKTVTNHMDEFDLFFISQPSAIDGNIWEDYNEFIKTMPEDSVVADVTYVGATKIPDVKINLNAKSIRNVVFSLSKPFGCYYDRIGGVFAREEDLGLFGNKWFKNLYSISLGSELLDRYPVDYMWNYFHTTQYKVIEELKDNYPNLVPSDVYILATYEHDGSNAIDNYLTRYKKARVCLTPLMTKYVVLLPVC